MIQIHNSKRSSNTGLVVLAKAASRVFKGLNQKVGMILAFNPESLCSADWCPINESVICKR